MQALFVLFVLVSIHQGLSEMSTFDDMISWAKHDVELTDEVLTDLDSKIVPSSALRPMNILMKFQLYTRSHPDDPTNLIPGDSVALKLSDFDASKPTKILIHGWLGNAKEVGSLCQMVRDEYFLLDSYNVVCVDWSVLAYDSLYFTARLRAKAMGEHVSKLISTIIDNTKQTPEDIHIIGFSLGAHIAGYAAKPFNGTIKRITGLDPARPLFSLNVPSERLNKDDAQLVDIVHTTYYFLGQYTSFGNIDFYPNFGYNEQPQCQFGAGDAIAALSEICSHFRSYEYFARSIRFKEEFKSVKCVNYNKAYRSSLQSCTDCAYLGEFASSSSSSGSYCLSIN